MSSHGPSSTFYKILGFLTWQIGRRYLRKRATDPKVIAGGIAIVVAAAAVAAGVLTRGGDREGTV